MGLSMMFSRFWVPYSEDRGSAIQAGDACTESVGMLVMTQEAQHRLARDLGECDACPAAAGSNSSAVTLPKPPC